MSSKLNLVTAQRRLAIIWFLGVAPSFILFVLETMGDSYAAVLAQAWEWFIPTWSPTLGLILAVLVAVETASPQQKTLLKKREVSGFFLWIAVGFTVFYQLLLFAAILTSALKRGPDERLDALHRGSFFLGPIQGLVAAALGVVYLRDHAGDHQ